MDRSEFEEELRALLRELEGEQEKATRRLTAARDSLNDIERKKAAIEATLQYYCAVHDVPYDVSEIDERLRERFKNMAAIDVVVTLARERGGLVVVKDIARTLARAALYAHERSANGSVYGMVDRHPDLFEKVGRGRFILKEPKADSQPADIEGAWEELPPIDWTPQSNQPIQRIAG